MTTAYVVQLNLPNGVKYVSTSGKLSDVPKFFRSASTVRSYLGYRSSASYYRNRFDRTKHEQLTQIVVIRDLEQGLKDSKAELLGYGQFMDLGPQGVKPRKSNPLAIYKIRKADGKFVTFGSPRPKHGKIWNRAGDLRSHITGKAWNGKIPADYKTAEVVEIIMGPDGIMPEKVTTYPLVDFYTASPDCRKRYKADIPTGHPYRQTEYA